MEKNQELYQEEQRQLLLDLNKGVSILSVKLQEQIDAYEVPAKSLEVSGEVKVNTEKTIEISNLTGLQEAIKNLETTLSTAIVENSYKPVDKVSVSNIKEAMPKDLAITNLKDLEKYFDNISKTIKANQPVIQVQKQNVVFPTSAGQPVSVRLSDGKSFYKAVAAIASAGLSKLAETNLESLLFDGSGNLKVSSTISGTVVAFAKSTEQYAINDTEATATYKYFGFQKSDGGWYIMRKTIATKKFEYVAGASAYSTAWTNRASQTYTDYATAF